jgi:hypothetical protein
MVGIGNMIHGKNRIHNRAPEGYIVFYVKKWVMCNVQIAK